jgi:predicted RNase H-like HicB family nuclease
MPIVSLGGLAGDQAGYQATVDRPAGSYLFSGALAPAKVLGAMSLSVTLTAVFTPDEDGWTMAQLAEWPAVVTCGRTSEAARAMLLDAAAEMIASYHEQGRTPPIGGGHTEQVTLDLAPAA